MTIRRRRLPPGWYPGEAEEVEEVLAQWGRGGGAEQRRALSVVVPHAGWYYSGRLSFETIRRIPASVETIVVVGGHLPAGDGILVHPEDAAETPLGTIEVDHELQTMVREQFPSTPDLSSDNTVEIHLPIIRYLFPHARYVGIRVSPTEISVGLGAAIGRVSSETGRRIALVGSTDLTHYGPAYGFSPHGTGASALRWASEENDRPFLEDIISMQFASALERARGQRAACSAGAAVAAAAFAQECGVETGKITGYSTSAEFGGGESFVGYGAMVFEKLSRR